MAEIVHGFSKDRLDITRGKEDIDFICNQLHEEMEITMKPQFNRSAKLLLRIGMMTISFFYFNSKIIYMFIAFEERGISYENLLSECKHNAAAYLNMRDAVLDSAFKDIDEDNL